MVKKALTARRDFTAASRAWRELTAVLGPISLEFSRLNADKTTQLVDEMLSAGVGMDDPVVVFLMDWIAEFERQFVQLEDAPPADVLRHLMMANGLKQTDLALELGGQSVVSAILNGRREINVRQARALAERFGVSPAIFIGGQVTGTQHVVQNEISRAHETPIEAFGVASVTPQHLNETYVAYVH